MKISLILFIILALFGSMLADRKKYDCETNLQSKYFYKGRLIKVEDGTKQWHQTASDGLNAHISGGRDVFYDSLSIIIQSYNKNKQH